MQPIFSVSDLHLRRAQKRPHGSFARYCSGLLALIAVSLVSGCSMVMDTVDHSLGVPTPLPQPTTVPTPEPVIFNASDNSPRGTNLNGGPGLPDSFAVTNPDGAYVTLHTVVKGVVSATGDPVHLAGIVAPRAGQPGGDKVAAAILNWTSGTMNDADIDPVFPTDTDGVRLVVVYFHRKDKTGADTVYCLNRMLVRAGLAVVDLYSPTYIKTEGWLSEEAYARIHHLGLWTVPDVFLHLQQRPANLPGSAVASAEATPTGTPAAAGGGLANPLPGGAPPPAPGASPAAAAPATPA